MPVLALLKRGGKVYTAIIPDTTTSIFLATIKERVQPDSIVYTDCFGAYDALDAAGFRHERINHSKLFVDQHNHIECPCGVSTEKPMKPCRINYKRGTGKLKISP